MTSLAELVKSLLAELAQSPLKKITFGRFPQLEQVSMFQTCTPELKAQVLAAADQAIAGGDVKLSRAMASMVQFFILN